MRDRKKLLAAMAVPAVLALGGGTALAQSAHSNAAASSGAGLAHQQSMSAGIQAENTKADPDNIQQGDQTSPDKPGQSGEEAKGPDTDNLQQGPGQQVQQGSQAAPDTPDRVADGSSR
jgi:hypothetical protein